MYVITCTKYSCFWFITLQLSIFFSLFILLCGPHFAATFFQQIENDSTLLVAVLPRPSLSLHNCGEIVFISLFYWLPKMIAIRIDKSWSASINQSGIVTAVKSVLREAIFGSLKFLCMYLLGIDLFSQFKKKSILTLQLVAETSSRSSKNYSLLLSKFKTGSVIFLLLLACSRRWLHLLV